MPLKTVDVARREGRVCYVTDEGSGRYVTVECPVERVAYRFRWDGGHVQSGDWVSFQGKARREIVSRKDEEERLRVIPYYHSPYDGSAQSEWSYIDVIEPEKPRRIGPLDRLDALRAAKEAVSAHIEDWYGSDSPEQIRQTLAALEAAADAMRSSLGSASARAEEARARTVAVDLEV